MIYRVGSTLGSFKALEFRPGLNVVIAEKAANSGLGQTRNKAGKSSLVLLIHWVLGGEGGVDSLFRKPELEAHTFHMDFDLAGAVVRASRRGSTYGRISLELLQGTVAEWPDDPFGDATTVEIAHNRWREVLGRVMFHTPREPGLYGPKFGLLFGYFARRSEEEGFASPQRHSTKQQPAGVRVALSYLIGLDWRISQRREQLRQDLEAAVKLQKAATSGALQDLIGDPTQILAKVTLAQREVARLSRAITTFRVLEDYRARETEANELTRRLNRAADESSQERFYIDDLRRSLETEEPPALDDLARLYSEVGVALPGVAVERYDQVRRFHESVVRNRRLYLEEELTLAQHRAEVRARLMDQLNARRAEVMTVLRTHGALEQHTELQRQLVKAEATAEQLRQKQELLNSAATRVAKLKIEQQKLYLQLQRDFKENERSLEEAIVTFEGASEELYTDPGHLSIFPTEAGPDFSVRIQGEKSRGVNSMQIFCFDLMLITMSTRRGRSPGFLVHDSHLYDPTDGRQKDHALAYGAALASELGFQYVVTINSDQIPADEDRSGFPIEEYILEPRLTDAPGGGLFGFEFD